LKNMTAIAIDFDRSAKLNQAHHEAIADGESADDATLRLRLAACLKRRDDYEEIKEANRDLRLKLDQAVARHAEITAPLQRELDGDDTPTDRRIAARIAVNDANAKLEADIAPLRKSLEAAEAEMQFLLSRGISPTVIENAYARGGPEAEQERVRVLDKVIELLKNGPCFAARKRAEQAETSLRYERERRKKEQRRSSSDDLRELERQERYHRGISDELGEFLRMARDEIEQIRRRRISELYGD
jgi:hypothetical protein